MNKKRSQCGFTLIELIVVLAVLVILAALAIPSFKKLQQGSQQTVCQTNQSAVYRALYIEQAAGINLNDAAISQILKDEFNAQQESGGYGGLCPSGGVYQITATLSDIQITCSKHGDSSLSLLNNAIGKIVELPTFTSYFSMGKTSLDSTGPNYGGTLKQEMIAALSLPDSNFDFRVYYNSQTKQYHIYIFQSLDGVQAGSTISATQYIWDCEKKAVVSTTAGSAPVIEKTTVDTNNKPVNHSVLQAENFKAS